MTSKRVQHLAFCFLISAVLTVGAVLWDSQRSGAHQTAAGLSWARQVASQADGMSLKARESGEKDPVGWAVNFLAQGVEPRQVRINKVLQTENSAGAETYSLDRDAAVLDYTKILSPESGAGVHVQVYLGYTGFLGARSELGGDLLGLTFFTFCFALLALTTARFFGFDDTSKIRFLVSGWVGGAKSQLTRLGVHIREMVRQSQRLAASAGKSRQLVGELRTKIHGGLNELHESRQFFQEFEAAAAKAEGLALSAMIEATRIGGDAMRVSDMAKEVHRCVQAMREATKKGQSMLVRMERKIEPWAMDSDLAYHAFDDVKEATDTLSQHIRATTETLIGQAKMIQSLHNDLGDPTVSTVGQREVGAPPPAPVAAVIESIHRQLPAPLPPIEEQEKKPFLSKFRLKKSA
jgi:hypothetical protein